MRSESPIRRLEAGCWLRRCSLRSSACWTRRRSTERSTGLVTKSKAPALSALTAASTLPCAVIIATGVSGKRWAISETRSMPLPSGRRMSVRHRSYFSAPSCARADARSAAVSTRRPIRPRVNTSSSRMSRSSSTTRALRSVAIGGLAGYGSNLSRKPRRRPSSLARRGGRLAVEQALRGRERDAEAAAAARDRLERQRALVGLAQLPRDVQAEAGAVLARGEERREHLLG